MFTFDDNTSPQVKSIVESAYKTGKRLRFFFMDSNGLDWCEEFESIGTIGRSTGDNKIPLLILNSRSSGGGSLATSCVGMITCDKKVIYRDPLYHVGNFEIRKGNDPVYDMEVWRNGALMAQFKEHAQAWRWIEFMQGKRNSK